jgi:dephospho-CoA kinase
MLLIGLTGSIGMGKSTVAARLRALSIPVFDADAEVHRLYAGDAVPLIAAAFPGTTVNGKVSRAALAAALLADPRGYARLEAIVHPLVRNAECVFLRQAAAAGAAMAVLEVPLLLETGGHRAVDVVIVVSAPAELQRARVLGRPGMEPARLEQVLQKQMSDAEKRRHADFVVDTGGTFAAADAQVDRIVESLKGREGSAYRRFWANANGGNFAGAARGGQPRG